MHVYVFNVYVHYSSLIEQVCKYDKLQIIDGWIPPGFFVIFPNLVILFMFLGKILESLRKLLYTRWLVYL